jgi:hypothetical protein
VSRRKLGGRDSEQLARAFAFVRTSFKGEEGKYVEHSFDVFPEVYLERTEDSSGPIETCVISLAWAIVASFQQDHFTCLNYFLMQELETIGQAIYMRVQPQQEKLAGIAQKV